MDIWAMAGKPDQSLVGKWFYRLPAQIRNRFNRSQERMWVRTVFYCWRTAYHSGRGSAYATFSQEHEGAAMGRSRHTVMRAMDWLIEQGLFQVQHRWPKAGQTFQTNLYRPTSKLLAFLGHLFSQVREKSPCSKSAPQEFQKKTLTAGAPPSRCAASQDKDIHDANDRSSAALRAFSQRWEALGFPGLLPPGADAAA